MDGFRKRLAQEFTDVWVIDLKGNARTSGERRRREGGNIFEDKIRVGVAVYFCVRNKKLKGCQIRYQAASDYAKADEKREFLSENSLAERTFDQITPTADGNWINQVENDFANLMPLATKATKAAKSASSERAIFKLFSLGVVTARDEWAYAETNTLLEAKIRYLINAFNGNCSRPFGHAGIGRGFAARVNRMASRARRERRRAVSTTERMSA